MCGIAGYYGTKQLDDGVLESTLNLMRRRGPDHLGRWTSRVGSERHIHLLHSRLSIIDLDARSHQPYFHNQKAMVLNGEIYNYLEIRSTLEKLGRSFHTTSDTEVLIQALDQFGFEAWKDCEGMWAAALFDRKTASLHLVRDRFGEKPLYFFRNESGIFFASEIKFIFALLGRKLPVNMNALYRYLVNGYKALYKQDAAFFVGIESVQPGTEMCIDREGEIQTHMYWQPNNLKVQDQMSWGEAVEGVKSRLIHSMQLRLRADVPLAFCMSGGVDSNALIAIAKRVFDYNVHGFTITNTDERYDERIYIDSSVQSLGIKHTSIELEQADFLSQLRTLVLQHDAPVYTITYYIHWFLMKAISEHGYRISLSGTGADELFSGYYDHHLFFLAEMSGDPSVFEVAKKNWEKWIAPNVRNPHLQDPQRFIRNPEFRDHIFLNAKELRSYLRNDWDEPFVEHSFGVSLLRNRMLNELFHEAVPVILHEDDLNAMYYSIENRSPFLDRTLFDFAYSIPTRHLIRNGLAKAVLREAMKGIVPDLILDNRKKVGFNAPVFDLLNAKDPEMSAWLFNSSPIYDHIKRDSITQLLQKESLPNSESKFLFYFLNCKIFLEEFAA